MTPSSTLAPIIAAVQRRWGHHALRRGDATPPRRTTIPTGSAALDTLLGGGIPRGAITEMRGRDGSGARSLALTIAAQAQAGDALVAYLDLGATFDPEYALLCGVDPAHVLVVRPADAIAALTIVQALLASGDVAALIVDDLTALVRSATALRRFDAAVTRWAPRVARSGCALIGLLDDAAAGAQALRAGSALAHAATLRLQIRRSGFVSQPGLFDPHARVTGTVAEVTVLSHADGHRAPARVSMRFSLPRP